MTRSRSTALVFIALLLPALLLAGCGDSTPKVGGSSASDGVALTHVDGTLAVSGDRVTVTPSTGAPVPLTIGPAVGKGELQALAASGAKARVFYAEKGAKIAAKVEAAPVDGASGNASGSASGSAKTLDGVITKVSKSSISILSSGGEAHTFSIHTEDQSAFDVAHLNEHAAEESPVRIHYRTGGDGSDFAVSYEDS
ncbi:MAG: hypothetical protein H7287_07525 [Thermoleophilia bacterium]|nr:hypothetical protein [Thermoleophilia bacterium]